MGTNTRLEEAGWVEEWWMTLMPRSRGRKNETVQRRETCALQKPVMYFFIGTKLTNYASFDKPTSCVNIASFDKPTSCVNIAARQDRRLKQPSIAYPGLSCGGPQPLLFSPLFKMKKDIFLLHGNHYCLVTFVRIFLVG
jgi:hypothetical protein